MNLFKKNKNEPIIIEYLRMDLEKAKKRNEKYFFHYVFSNDIKTVRQWAKKNGIVMDASYIIDGVICYKFYGWENNK